MAVCPCTMLRSRATFKCAGSPPRSIAQLPQVVKMLLKSARGQHGDTSLMWEKTLGLRASR
eukprot:758273-Hanusia_phi.AAC.1